MKNISANKGSHPTYIETCKNKFIHALSNASMNERGFFNAGFYQNYREVEEAVLKNEGIAKYLESIELLDYFILLGPKVAKLNDKTEKSLVKDRLTYAQIGRLADEFVEFLNGLPYKHDVYIQLPIELPAGFNEIVVTSYFKLQREQTPKIPISEGIQSQAGVGAWGGLGSPGVLGAWGGAGGLGSLASYGLLQPNEKVYAVIQADGFSGSASRHATSLIKQFLFLCARSSLVGTGTQYSAPLSARSDYFIRPGLEDEAEYFSSPSNVSAYLSRVGFAKNLFIPEGMGRPSLVQAVAHFQAKIQSFVNLHSPKIKDERGYIEAALEWGFDGMANDNETFGFIQTCIGLEAILGDDTKERVTDRLADRCALLIGKTRRQRDEIREKFLKIYSVRSQLVHGRRAHIEAEGREMAFYASKYLGQLIQNEIEDLFKFTPDLK